MVTLHETGPLVALGLNTVLVFLVLRRHIHSRKHQVFSLFLISMGLWAFTIWGMRSSPTLAAALPWEKAIFAILAFVSVTFYHFVRLLTEFNGGKWQLYLAYLSAVVFASLAGTTDLVVAGMREMWYGHGFVPGPLMLPYMFIFYGFVVLALFLIVRAYLSAQVHLEKSRYAYVGAGAFFCLLGVLGDVLAASGTGIYPTGIPSNILFSSLCAYAMLKYQLMDVRVIMRKGTAYFLISAMAAGLYFGLLFIAYTFITSTWSLPLWLEVTFVLVVAIGLQPMLRRVQGLVDK